jgi:DNA anti-recombination protein RmuC
MHLPKAIDRFETALMFVPGDGYISSMLQRANELLTDANEFPDN